MYPQVINNYYNDANTGYAYRQPYYRPVSLHHKLANYLDTPYQEQSSPYYGQPLNTHHTQLTSALNRVQHDTFHQPVKPALPQTYTHPVRPLVAHVLAHQPEQQATTIPAKAKPNMLMRNPFRQLGFLNEYAEIFKSIIPANIYKGLWGVEMAYIGAESVLSSLINARRDAVQNHLTPRETVKSDFTHLGKRALFHSIATVGVPTLLISGLSPLTGKEMHGLAGGLKGVAEMALKTSGASAPVIKYGTVGLTFLTLPFMSKFLDPVVEAGLHKILPQDS